MLPFAVIDAPQLTLLERALRRAHPGSSKDPATATAAPAADGTRTGMPEPQHPMNEHLEWCLPSIAALFRVLQALSAADAAGALGPLQVCPVGLLDTCVPCALCVRAASGVLAWQPVDNVCTAIMGTA